jgi:hypothetical protein
MNAKTEGIDPSRLLVAKSIPAHQFRSLAISKTHHNNPGGAGCVYLDNSRDIGPAFDMLRTTAGVEEIDLAKDAARLFHLHPERIAGSVGLMKLIPIKNALYRVERVSSRLERNVGQLTKAPS